MKNKGLLILAICLAATLIVGLSWAADEKCPLCGMNIAGNENTAFEITMNDGSVATYCCPHCGLWEMHANKANIKSARARDFISGEWMDATKMFYVVKSSAVPACAPSWIAFGSKSEAGKFTKGFGGKVLNFSAAIKERGKHPKEMKEMKMKK